MDAKRNEERGNGSAEQTRVEYRLPVTVEGDDATGAPFSERTIVENVTRAGAFVVTKRPLAAGALLALHDADDHTERLCYVQVVWVRGDDAGSPGAGVRIVNDNGRWMAYLIAHSVQALDEEPPSVE